MSDDRSEPTKDQVLQAMDQMKAHYDTELAQAITSIQMLEARLAAVEALCDEAEADDIILIYVSDVRAAARWVHERPAEDGA